jgi:predicted transcriptional regulator
MCCSVRVPKKWISYYPCCNKKVWCLLLTMTPPRIIELYLRMLKRGRLTKSKRRLRCTSCESKRDRHVKTPTIVFYIQRTDLKSKFYYFANKSYFFFLISLRLHQTVNSVYNMLYQYCVHLYFLPYLPLQT